MIDWRWPPSTPPGILNTPPRFGILVYGAHCSGGHAMRRPWERTLAITLLDKRFQITIGVKPANIWRTPVCGKCLGIQ